MRVVVCEPGASNVRSVVRAIQRAAPEASVTVTRDPDVVRHADRLVVPGQGSFAAFASAMQGGLGEAVVERIAAGVPYLGICLGLQGLFEESDEAPGVRGLGVFRGRVVRLPARPSLPVPHMGWNEVSGRGTSLVPRRAFFYFAHSYVAEPADPRIVAGVTDYGGEIVTAVRKDACLGVQFHPEKSQGEGLALLARFFEKG